MRAALCFYWINRQCEHLTSWQVELFLHFVWLWKCRQRAKTIERATQTTCRAWLFQSQHTRYLNEYQSVKSAPFFLSFVLIDYGLIHGRETIFKYLFFIYCESTPTRLRHIRPPLAMRLSIMLKTLASPMSSDFLRGLWNHEFDAFAFLLLIKHVCICVYFLTLVECLSRHFNLSV